jgi:hypothetical protein
MPANSSAMLMAGLTNGTVHVDIEWGTILSPQISPSSIRSAQQASGGDYLRDYPPLLLVPDPGYPGQVQDTGFCVKC